MITTCHENFIMGMAIAAMVGFLIGAFVAWKELQL